MFKEFVCCGDEKVDNRDKVSFQRYLKGQTIFCLNWIKSSKRLRIGCLCKESFGLDFESIPSFFSAVVAQHFKSLQMAPRAEFRKHASVLIW